MEHRTRPLLPEVSGVQMDEMCIRDSVQRYGPRYTKRNGGVLKVLSPHSEINTGLRKTKKYYEAELWEPGILGGRLVLKEVIEPWSVELQM